MKIPKLDWVSFNSNNPPADLDDSEDAYLILIEDKGYPPHYQNEPYDYYMDVATAYGSYLDNFWNTTNDWCEGNDIHVIAYCYLGGQIKVEEINKYLKGEKIMDFKIIAVDFDGTLCENKWPEIGEPNKELIAYLKEQKETGVKLILWTCRVGEILENAVKWSAEQGLIFDTVNKNLPEVIAFMGGDTRKIFANEYIDDRNFGYRPVGLISEEMSQSDRMELWGRLIDVVEDWLVEKGITEEDIPNEEREDVEDAAIIFGDDYDYFADRFAEVIGISRDNLREV